MDWIRGKLGLTPSPSSNQREEATAAAADRDDESSSSMSAAADNQVGVEHEQQQARVVFYDNDNNDDDDDSGSNNDGDDGAEGNELKYLTQLPDNNDDDTEDEEDDNSELKESSSVDIEAVGDGGGADNEEEEEDNEQQQQHRQAISRKRGGGGRAKRQSGDLLSKLPTTPTQQSSSSPPLKTTSELLQEVASSSTKNERSKQKAATTRTSSSSKKSPKRKAKSSLPKDAHDTTTNHYSPTLARNINKTTTKEEISKNTKNAQDNLTQSPPSSSLPKEYHNPMLHKLSMKERAINRSILHLSDNSYSFVYDDGRTNDASSKSIKAGGAAAATAKGSNSVKNSDFISWSPPPKSTTTHEVSGTTTSVMENNKQEQQQQQQQQSKNNNDGLPFIGPGLKDQYETLQKLLRDGLLGTYNDDDDDDNTDYNNVVNIIDNMKPKIQSNVSAVLMGPRGHGKSLVLERCLAELERMAGRRKGRLLEKMKVHQLQLQLQQQQQQQDQQQQQKKRRKKNVDAVTVTTNSSSNQFNKVKELYTQASFRVVRINGLLYQGDNAIACTREIARQINAMSRIEKKKRSSSCGTSSSSSKRKMMTGEVNSPVKSPSKRMRGVGNEGEISTPSKLTPSKLSPTKPSPLHSPKSPMNNDEAHQFRLRKSGFNTNISLLDEALRTARIDGIPILIVLEELDTFLAGGKSYNMMTDQISQEQGSGSNDRQLLLYHLLDRVADHKFLVSLVGMTTNLSTINQLEKRVQSRAEGTSKVIYFGHDVSGGYDACVDTLLGKFYTPPIFSSSLRSGAEEDNSGTTEEMEMMNLKSEVEAIFRGNNQTGSTDEDQEINDFALVQRALRRNYEMHMDIRWFCGLLDIALSLLMSDIEEQKLLCSGNSDTALSSSSLANSTPTLLPKHITHALVMMGASLDIASNTGGRPGVLNQNEFEQIRWGQLLEDPNHYYTLVGTTPRLVALLDLSGPQIAILLAARRIMARDEARSTVDDDVVGGRNGNNKNAKNGSKNVSVLSLIAPLTYKRMEDEYTTSFVNSERYTISSDRYPPHVLYRSFMDLMELDLIRLKKEHCGGGALQYESLSSLSTGANITNLPLYVNLEWELDFIGVLKAGLLKCSTSLREWGLKMN